MSDDSIHTSGTAALGGGGGDERAASRTTLASESTGPLTDGFPDLASGSGEYVIEARTGVQFADGTDIGSDDQLGPLEEAALAHRLALKEAAHALPSCLRALEHAFESALRSLYISFQPIVRCDESTFGYEALLRPNDSVLSHPVAMLEAAERLGRIEELGRVIRRRSAEAFMSSREHAQTVLFVNLHAADLADRSLVSRFAALTQIADQVVLEITEQTSLEHLTDIRQRVAELRALGFHIAIDDLGAGHSRMRLLHPVDTDFVKLDQSLVRRIDDCATRRKLVGSIVKQCHQHGIAVIGEGVETRSEARALIDAGCDLLQGFLFGRPLRIPA